MPLIIELINYKLYATDYIHKLWQDDGVTHKIISVNRHTNPTVAQPDYEIPIQLLATNSTKNQVVHILKQYFLIPKCISKNPLIYKNIIRYPRLIINSLILHKTIKHIEKKYKSANAILLHHAYGTETPYFHHSRKTFFYLHSSISKAWVWASTKQQKRTRHIFKNQNVIACGVASMQDFKTLNIPYKSLDYAPNGVNISMLRKQSKKPLPTAYQGIPYIVCVCRLSPEKQIPEMIQAFINANLNCTFIIVGKGQEQHKIEQKIAELNCADKVILYGFDKNPARWLKHAVFSMVFSSYEGAPRTIPESLCLGTPVIISDQVTDEYFDDSLMPYVIPYQDIDALTTAMQHMYHTPVVVSHTLQNAYDLKQQIKKQKYILQQNGCL